MDTSSEVSTKASEPKVSRNQGIHKALTDMIKDLSTSPNYRLSKTDILYRRLLEKIDPDDAVQMNKLLNGLRIFMCVNDSAHVRSIVNNKLRDIADNVIIAFGENSLRIYLNIGLAISRLDDAELVVLRKHLLLMCTLLDPSKDKIQLLKDLNGEGAESVFVTNLVSNITLKTEDIKGNDSDDEVDQAMVKIMETLPTMMKDIKSGVKTGKYQAPVLLKNLQTAMFAQTGTRPEKTKMTAKQARQQTKTAKREE